MLRFGYPRYLRDSLSLITEIRGGCRTAKRPRNRSVIATKASTSTIMTNDLDIKRCFEFAKKLTLEAGKIFNDGFEGEKNVETKAGEWDLVTNYDRRLEEFFISGLTAEFPDHVIIGEESTAATKQVPQLTDKPTWLIDPIDGTMNYVHAFPQTCISVGLAVCKDVVLGIVYDPVHSELYTAIKGEGAFLNDKPIRTSNTMELKKSLLVFEPFTMLTSSKNKDIRTGRFEALLSASRGMRSIGSAALTLALVARGSVDCFHMDGLKPWDVAAGMLIVREAGGAVIDTKGGEYDVMNPNTIAAASDVLASETKELIVETDLKVLRKRLWRS